MQTFEQQLREWIEHEAAQAFPTNTEKQFILFGAELLLPMVVEMFEALNKTDNTSDCMWALEIVDETIESIQKKIKVQKNEN